MKKIQGNAWSNPAPYSKIWVINQKTLLSAKTFTKRGGLIPTHKVFMLPTKLVYVWLKSMEDLLLPSSMLWDLRTEATS